MAKLIKTIQKVKEYYDTSTRWYRWFYYDKDNLALHYGFWEHPKESRSDALKNQYREMANLLNPQPGEVILDAGCGVGGASLWLAQHTQANYLGITISPKQVKMAKANAQRKKLEDRVKFLERNYFNTKFIRGEFDKIFAIESFCYSYPHPTKLYYEMYRILKPGGRLVISDGVLLRQPQNGYEEKITRKFCEGFKMTGWNTPAEIKNALKKAGFKNVRHIDKTKEIEKSVIDIWKRSKMASPLLWVLRYMGVATKTESENLLATYSQKEMYKLGLFGYGIFVGDKSRTRMM